MGMGLGQLGGLGRLGRPTLEGVGEVWPPVGATTALDFENNRFFWDGQQRQFSDLTAAAGTPSLSSGYTPGASDRLNFAAAAMPDLFGGVVEIEFGISSYPADDDCILSFHGGSGGTRSRFEFYTDFPGLTGPEVPQKLYMQYYNGGVVSTDFGDAYTWSAYPISQTTRRKALWRWADGGKLKAAAAGRVVTSTGSNFGVTATTDQRWSTGGIAYRAFDNTQQYTAGSIKRITIWPDLSDAEMAARSLITPKTNIHMLGDSFVTSGLAGAVVGNLGDDFRAFTRDGVGGTDMAAQDTRYAATTDFHPRGLIIMDGGLSDADPIAQITSIKNRNTSGRWAYVQAVYQSDWTPAQVSARLAIDAAIEAAFPDNFIPTYAYMRANGGGGTTGPNGGEVWALNNYIGGGDTTHMNTATGEPNLGACIAAWWLAKGW